MLPCHKHKLRQVNLPSERFISLLFNILEGMRENSSCSLQSLFNLIVFIAVQCNRTWKTQPVEHPCLIDVGLARVSRIEVCPASNLKKSCWSERATGDCYMQIILKKQKMIYTKCYLVKMMKMHPENNLGGKGCGLQKINNKIDI